MFTLFQHVRVSPSLFTLHRSAEWTDVTQQRVSGKAGCCPGSAALHSIPGPPTPVCRGRGFRPERPGEEDQRGKNTIVQHETVILSPKTTILTIYHHG